MHLVSKLLLLLFLLNPINILSSECFYDDENLELEKLAEMIGVDYNPNQKPERKAPVDPCEIIDLIESFSGEELLKEDLYIKTYPLKTRCLFNLPVFLLRKYNSNQYTFGIDLFLNQVNRAKFTDESYFLKDYIALENQTIIRKLEELYENQFIGTNMPPILSLFKNVKTQERRAGLMFNIKKKLKRFTIGLRFPILYTERNYYLTTREIEHIENAQIYASDANFDDFIKNHLVSDKIGIGDLRLNFEGRSLNKRHLSIDLGLELSIPVNFTLNKRLIGTNFKLENKKPKFKLEEIFNLASQENIDTAKLKLQEFLIGALDKLSSNLLNPQLGSQRHLRIQGFLEPIIKAADNFSLKNRLSLEYLFPAEEKRFFIAKQNPKKFDRYYNSLNGNCQAKLNFINQEIINKFYPFVFDTKTAPGFIFQLTSSLALSSTHWELDLGQDLWWQAKEGFLSINNRGIDIEKLNINIAKRPEAYQYKIFSHLQFHMIADNIDWMLSLNFDKTLINSGIGNDFTLTLGIEFSF